MKQPAVKGSKNRRKGFLAGKEESNENTTAKKSNGSLSTANQSKPDRIPGVVYFKQLAFHRRGGRRMIAPTKKQAEPLVEVEKQVEELTLVHPLAVYEGTWLNAKGHTVHVSLIDRSHGSETSRFFLRIGTVLEHPEGTVEDLQVLEVLQNDIGKLLTPPLQYWIDLNVINVDEYYMSTFLQQSLQHIAHRVHKPSKYLSSTVDQVCLVEAVYETATETEGEVFDDGFEGGRGKKSKGNLIAVITEQALHGRARKRNDREVVVDAADSAPPRDQSSSRAPQGPDLALDKTIAQRSARIPIGAVYENETVMTTVRMSIMYPDAESLLHDPLPLKHDEIKAKIPAKHVVLHVYPFYSEHKIAPKIVSLEPASLSVLIGDVNVDDIIDEGVRAVAQLLAKLTRLLYFRVDSLGRHRLGVTGAAILAANETAGEESDEDHVAAVVESSIIKQESEQEVAKRLREEAIEARMHSMMIRSKCCVVIQSLWRMALARSRFGKLRILNQMVIRIQCLARRIISRYRVRQRRHQKSIELAVVPSAEAWVPSLLADWCPAHNRSECPCTKHECVLRGTEVCLFFMFATTGFTGRPEDTLLTVADKNDSELICRTSISVSAQEKIASSLYHMHHVHEHDEVPFLPPEEALSYMLADSPKCTEMLASIADGLDLFVNRQMEFLKCTFDVNKVSTRFETFMHGDTLVVGI